METLHSGSDRIKQEINSSQVDIELAHIFCRVLRCDKRLLYCYAYKLSHSPNQRSSRRVFVGDIGCRIGDIAASEHLQGIPEKKYQKVLELFKSGQNATVILSLGCASTFFYFKSKL